MLHSFPTRRSSDLTSLRAPLQISSDNKWGHARMALSPDGLHIVCLTDVSCTLYHVLNGTKLWSFKQGKDRKSTRLNSSHRCISYAVFCLKKKNGILLHGVGNEEQPLLKPERSGVRDAFDDEISGMFDRGQCAGVEPRRGRIRLRGRRALRK